MRLPRSGVRAGQGKKSLTSQHHTRPEAGDRGKMPLLQIVSVAVPAQAVGAACVHGCTYVAERTDARERRCRDCPTIFFGYHRVHV